MYVWLRAVRSPRLFHREEGDQTLQPFQKGVWGAEGMHASSRPQPFHRAGRMTKWVATVGGGGGEAGLLPGRNHI